MARFTLLLVVLAFVSANSLHLEKKLKEIEQHQREQFVQFVFDFGRNYKTHEEYEHRFKIFQKNLAKIEELNANELGTAVYGINKFADLTKEELTPSYCYRSKNVSNLAAAQIPQIEAPASFDWRSKNVIQNVKDQAQCGSCWAFSAVSNIESVHAIATGQLYSLSEQQLVDCDKSSAGCNGGEMISGIQTAINEGGLQLESAYPYTARDGSCHYTSSPLYARPSSVHRIGNLFTGANENDMLNYVASTAPLSIGINADRLQSYLSGVIQPTATNCSPNGVDHGVNIIGYGVSGATPYWIVRNSWGKSWGESGYFRIVRGTGACGLNTDVVSAVA